MRSKILIVLVIICYSLVTQSFITAQSGNTVFVCVEPLTSTNPPYIVQFRNTEAFGFVVLENAYVTIYGEKQLSAMLHSINFDTQSGGYRIQDPVNLAISNKAIRNSPNCESILTNNDLSNLTATIRLPVSTRYLLSVDTDAPSTFTTPSIRGVFSYHFQKFPPRFQVIQQSPGDIEVRFPFLNNPAPADNTYIVISNKSLKIAEEYAEGYIDDISTLSRPSFIETLANAGASPLYEIMQADNVCIYPVSGRILPYPAGKFLRLKTEDPNAPNRDIKVGDVIRPLTGTTFQYYAEGSEGIKSSIDRATVREIDDRGRLIVGVPGGANLVVEYPCLVEHSTPE